MAEAHGETAIQLPAVRDRIDHGADVDDEHNVVDLDGPGFGVDADVDRITSEIIVLGISVRVFAVINADVRAFFSPLGDERRHNDLPRDRRAAVGGDECAVA